MVGQEASSEEPDSLPPSGLVKQRRPWLVVLVVLAVLAGGVTALLLLLRGKPDPMTVLVAVELDGGWWQGSQPSAIIADRVAERLEALGFQPLKAGDPELTAELEDADSPEVAAKTAGATFVISGRLEPTVVEHPIEGGYYEARVTGAISLLSVGKPPQQAGVVSSWSGARTREQALALLARGLGDKVFDAALPALMAREPLQELAKGPIADSARLTLARGYVELREKTLADTAAAYAALPAERKAKERSRNVIRYGGAFDRNATLCAVTKKGVLIREDRWRPFFSPGNNELRYHSELERLLWLSDDGAKEEEIFVGYNIYSYPSADESGDRVVLIEDLFGAARAISLIEGKSPIKRLRVEPRRWHSEPKVAPDGSAVALWDRPCRRCPARLLVLGLPTGKELFAAEEGQSALGGFTWVGPARLVYLERPAPEGEDEDKPSRGDQRLVELDLSVTPPRSEVLHTAVASESYGPPSASRDGRWIAMSRRGHLGQALALFDRTAKELTVHSTERDIDRPAMSPDGSLVAFQWSGDVGILNVADGKVTRLTHNPFLERYPQFSLDGRRVWFESQTRDPSFSSKSLSVPASVELP